VDYVAWRFRGCWCSFDKKDSMNEEICKAMIGFRGIEELAVTAGREEPSGTYDPESLRRAEACLETALDKVRLAKALVGNERRDSARETLAVKAPVHHLDAPEA
jgi:hypothetical protein